MYRIFWVQKYTLNHIFKTLISDYLLVCRFVPVLVLPRYSVATGSISPPSQYGRTVLWNSHVKTKIKRYLEFLEDWTVIRLIFQCPGTRSLHCLQQKLLPEGITPFLWCSAFALLKYHKAWQRNFSRKSIGQKQQKSDLSEKSRLSKSDSKKEAKRCHLIVHKLRMSGKPMELSKTAKSYPHQDSHSEHTNEIVYKQEEKWQ